MTKRWEPDFDFWAARLDEMAAQMFLDMAAAAHAPLLTHPVRLQVRVPLAEQREDGLLAEGEAEALYAVEDAIAGRLEGALDAIFVGRLVAEGRATFVFYLTPAGGKRADEEAGRLVRDVAAPYAVKWRVEDDAGWAYYRELLYPDDESKQAMLDRRARDKVLGVGA